LSTQITVKPSNSISTANAAVGSDDIRNIQDHRRRLCATQATRAHRHCKVLPQY
jgi:hypothetical protein